MIKKCLLSLEDPEKPLYGPNYRFLKKIGLILPENFIKKILYMMLHETVAFFVCTQYVELYMIRSNLDLALTNMKISIVECVVKAHTFVVWQKNWADLIDYLTAADILERDTEDPNRKNILDKYTKYFRHVTYVYWLLILITLTAQTIALPLIVYLSSATYRESLRNGTELCPHVLSSWVPFDKYHSPGCWITHVFVASYGASVMAAYDSNVMVVMVFFGGKLELLRDRCKHMLGANGVPLSDGEAVEKMRDLHETHAQLIKYIKLFNSLLSPVMFLYIILCSMLLCASAYQLSFGNLMVGPYESEWWAANVKQRKGVLLLAGQLRLTTVFSAGPFTDLTLSTFVTILKGACYYALLRK